MQTTATDEITPDETEVDPRIVAELNKTIQAVTDKQAEGGLARPAPIKPFGDAEIKLLNALAYTFDLEPTDAVALADAAKISEGAARFHLQSLTERGALSCEYRRRPGQKKRNHTQTRFYSLASPQLRINAEYFSVDAASAPPWE